MLAATGAVCALALAGCGKLGIGSSESEDPDRVAAGNAERELIAAYDAVIAAHPDVAELCSALKAEHGEHLVALLGPESSATPSAGSAPTTSPLVTPEELAGKAKSLRALMRAEIAASKARAEQCPGASDVALVRLLADIAASEAGHGSALKLAVAGQGPS